MRLRRRRDLEAFQLEMQERAVWQVSGMRVAAVVVAYLRLAPTDVLPVCHARKQKFANGRHGCCSGGGCSGGKGCP